MEMLMKDFDELNRSSESAGLISIIKGLRDRFYTIEEFPFIKREILPQGILSQAMSITETEIEDFAFQLKGKELEGLILDLRDTSDPRKIERASQILDIRSTPRILKLLTILFQFNYESQGLIEALNRIAARIKAKEKYSVEEAFVWHLGQVKDKLSALCYIIDDYEKDINKTFEALMINNKSPFACESAFRYLSYASKEGLMANFKWIVWTIDCKTAEELQKLLTNYLSTFTLAEYHDGINLAILRKLGQPNISPDWAPYDKTLRDQFTQWYFLNRLRIHTICMPKKYKILSKYHQQVLSSREMPEENLMIIDFGDIVIADIANRPYSFFYEKAVFKKEMEAWEKSKEQEETILDDGKDEKPTPYQPTFLRIDRQNLTARDFIIEEIEEPCVKLSYEGIDVLYINEMMDIKIGLEPDMRRKQLAKLKKRGKVNKQLI